MSDVPGPLPRSVTRAGSTESELRWLHDKYEPLAAEEGQLTASRTSYFAAIGTVLVTGLVVAIADLLSQPWVLAAVVTFLAALGLLISAVWAVRLHRTHRRPDPMAGGRAVGSSRRQRCSRRAAGPDHACAREPS